MALFDKNNLDKNKNKVPPPNGEGDQRVPLKSFAIWVILIIGLVALWVYNKNTDIKYQVLQYSPAFLEAVDKGYIKTAVIVTENNGQEFARGTINENAILKISKGSDIVEKHFPNGGEYEVKLNLAFDDELAKMLRSKGVIVDFARNDSVWLTVLLNILPFFFLLGILYFLVIRPLRMSGRGAMNFGKSRARLLSREKNKVTFKDVAGIEEAKEEVQELVEFLRDPKKFQKLGGRIPKGVLMVGPPGTGKTLLAKAIAGEADVPFFSISGSDFVEMFVGVGASRVRDMFEQGKKQAPCLIFIDEIDAVGRHRGHGLGGGHDEREQTLNALLVEMDGFDTQEGVIIIAATNRKDVLDPALLRPGRFDRELHVNLPDVKGRADILKVHAKNVKMDKDVDLMVIARGTPGYSGAELANVINEAALLAAKKGRKSVTMSELEEARDKVRWGRERRSLALTEVEKKNTAYHEAGHALVNVMLEHTDPVHKVTIIPRGPALGVTMMLPEEDKHNHNRRELIDQLAVLMGGRIAEEIFIGDVSTGAAGDIRHASRLSRAMVCQWGMSDSLGMIEYGEQEEHIFLGREMNRVKEFSEETQQSIDREVRKLIDNAYNTARRLLEENREKAIAIAEALLEFETLDGKQIEEIVHTGRMSNPPKINSSVNPDSTPDQKQEMVDSGSSTPEGPVTGMPTSPAPA